MKEMVCIVCPNSCLLQIKEKDGKITVEGARCKKGREFATEEMTAPRRALSSTVKTVFAELPVVPVRTQGEILKADIPAVMRCINGCVIDKVYGAGEVVMENAAGSGVNIICTVDMNRYI
ncbi:MAG: DUF1667 domain-containing protein [Christensenellales bacterium]|jgi:CxxC motif-containing protein